MSSAKKGNIKNTHKSNFYKDFLISGFSSAIGKTMVAPVERIKLLLQNQHIISSVDKKYIGIYDCGAQVVQREGFLSLWRGNLSNVLRYLPNQALNFAFKDTFKHWFHKYDKNKEFYKLLLANCAAGGIAGAVSLGIVYPLDFVRTRLATDNVNSKGIRDFHGSLDLIKKIFKKDGIRGLYKGYVIAVIGIIPYRAFYFGVYDSFKETEVMKKSGVLLKFLLAQIVTNIGSVLVYPLDTIRRRIMLQSGKDIDSIDYSSSLDCARKMRLEEGLLGFYKGFGANIIRGSGPALVLVLYDYIKEHLGLE